MEYTVFKPALEAQPRHLLSSVSLGNNGRYNRLITVRSQRGAQAPPTRLVPCPSTAPPQEDSCCPPRPCAPPPWARTRMPPQVTAQCRESQLDQFRPVLEQMLASYTPPAKRA